MAGMATTQPTPTRKPKYKNTVVCPNPHCDAEFTPSDHWYTGFDINSNTTKPPEFHATGKLRKSQCPGCREDLPELKNEGDRTK